MKKLKTKKAVVVIFVILILIAAYLFYSRPMTIQQRYPMLSLDKCTELRGYYKIDGQTELTEFTIDKNSEEFEMLWGLLYDKDYHRSLKDLFPRGTRIHPTEPGDFEWEVYFHLKMLSSLMGTLVQVESFASNVGMVNWTFILTTICFPAIQMNRKHGRRKFLT